MGRLAPLARARGDSLLRNSVLMMGTTAVNLALGYAFWLVAARSYSVSEVGLGAAAISAMTLAAALSNLGIGNAFVQLLPGRASGREWSETVNAGLVAGSVLGLLVGAVMLVIFALTPGDLSKVASDPAWITVFLVSVVCWLVADLLDKTFIAERASGRMLARNTAASAIKLPVLLVPFVAAAGALGVFGSWTIATAASAVLAVVLMRGLNRGYRPGLDGVARSFGRMLHTSAGHHLISVGNLAPGYLLPLVITGLLSSADNAYFYTTWRVGGVFFIISASVGVSLFAEGSHAADRLGRTVWRSSLIIAAMLGPTMIFFLAFGPEILGLLGPGYREHGTVLLALLTISAIPDAITNVYVAVLRVQRRLRFGAMLTLGMAVITVGLGAALVVPFGINGAGIGWLAAQCAGSVVVGIDLLRRRRRA
jgi:O-antigen/teichoic acid export membrane protein